MTDRSRRISYENAGYISGKMVNDLSPKKTMLVVVIVVGCFAVLWPKVFYPMIVGSANNRIKPSPIDRTQGCCDVISEKDLTTIKLISEICSTIIPNDVDNPLSNKELISKCKNAVLETCGIDISSMLQQKVRLGHTTKQILEEIRSLNGSLCLKYNFGVAPWTLGVPHRITIKMSPSYSIKQERPLHLRSEMIHPAFRERGRAIPQAESFPPTKPSPPSRIISKVVEGRPGPIPGMRPTIGGAGHVVPPSKHGGNSMGLIMPIYTIGIVVFFAYTVMKIAFKKQPEVLYPPVDPDPQFKREVFEADRGHLGSQVTKDGSSSKLGWKERDARDTEMDQLRRRLRETELAMERIVEQMAKVPLKFQDVVVNGSVLNKEDDQGSVQVLGMETTASCEGGQKWTRPNSPVIPVSHPTPEPEIPPQEIILEGSLPPQSHLLVTDSATEAQKQEFEDDPAVVLAGKMTLSVISLDSTENGTDESSSSSKKNEDRSSSNVSEEFEKIDVSQLEEHIDEAHAPFEQDILVEILKDIENLELKTELDDIKQELVNTETPAHTEKDLQVIESDIEQEPINIEYLETQELSPLPKQDILDISDHKKLSAIIEPDNSDYFLGERQEIEDTASSIQEENSDILVAVQSTPLDQESTDNIREKPIKSAPIDIIRQEAINIKYPESERELPTYNIRRESINAKYTDTKEELPISDIYIEPNQELLIGQESVNAKREETNEINAGLTEVKQDEQVTKQLDENIAPSETISTTGLSNDKVENKAESEQIEVTSDGIKKVLEQNPTRAKDTTNFLALPGTDLIEHKEINHPHFQSELIVVDEEYHSKPVDVPKESTVKPTLEALEVEMCNCNESFSIQLAIYEYESILPKCSSMCTGNVKCIYDIPSSDLPEVIDNKDGPIENKNKCICGEQIHLSSNENVSNTKIKSLKLNKKQKTLPSNKTKMRKKETLTYPCSSDGDIKITKFKLKPTGGGSPKNSPRKTKTKTDPNKNANNQNAARQNKVKASSKQNQRKTSVSSAKKTQTNLPSKYIPRPPIHSLSKLYSNKLISTANLNTQRDPPITRNIQTQFDKTDQDTQTIQTLDDDTKKYVGYTQTEPQAKEEQEAQTEKSLNKNHFTKSVLLEISLDDLCTCPEFCQHNKEDTGGKEIVPDVIEYLSDDDDENLEEEEVDEEEVEEEEEVEDEEESEEEEEDYEGDEIDDEQIAHV